MALTTSHVTVVVASLDPTVRPMLMSAKPDQDSAIMGNAATHMGSMHALVIPVTLGHTAVRILTNVPQIPVLTASTAPTSTVVTTASVLVAMTSTATAQTTVKVAMTTQVAIMTKQAAMTTKAAMTFQ